MGSCEETKRCGVTTAGASAARQVDRGDDQGLKRGFRSVSKKRLPWYRNTEVRHAPIVAGPARPVRTNSVEQARLVTASQGNIEIRCDISYVSTASRFLHAYSLSLLLWRFVVGGSAQNESAARLAVM